MEKFQIAKCGMMQVTAIVYGVLASGAMVKFCNRLYPQDLSFMPPGYYRAIFYYHYGLLLFAVVIGWTISASYLSSPFSPWQFDSDKLAYTGLALAILFGVLSSFFAFGGLAALFPPSS